MQLNESAQKLDSQLDQVCRKLEKVAFDTAPDANLTELTFYPNFNQKQNGSKYPYCSDVPSVVSYKQYIKTFTWNTLKYSTKRSLLELTALITKVSAKA